MMRIRRMWLCLLFAALLNGIGSGCQNAKLASNKLDQKVLDEALVKLQGEWTLESMLDDGSASAQLCVCDFGQSEFTEQWPDVSLVDQQNSILSPIRFKFNIYNIQNQLVMKTIILSGGMTGSERYTIFRFRDDKLEICYLSKPSKVDEIPNSFDGKAGSGQTLMVLRKRPEKPTN
jgi:hypothetical protein